jgi:hypothetical protein
MKREKEGERGTWEDRAKDERVRVAQAHIPVQIDRNILAPLIKTRPGNNYCPPSSSPSALFSLSSAYLPVPSQ